MSGIWTENVSDVRDMASFNWPYPWHRFLMSGIWPVFTGHIPDIEFWCPGYGQFLLAISRTSNVDVRNMDSENWPYSGHCPYPGHRAMSGRWPGRAMGLDPFLLFRPSLKKQGVEFDDSLALSVFWPYMYTLTKWLCYVILSYMIIVDMASPLAVKLRVPFTIKLIW